VVKSTFVSNREKGHTLNSERQSCSEGDRVLLIIDKRSLARRNLASAHYGEQIVS
jgi:hypothetical protein